MAQRLRSPIDSMKPTVGYKNSEYKNTFKYTHYGIDVISTDKDTKLYGLGDGIVAVAGLDGMNGKTTGDGSGCGYVLVIVYEDCINNKTGKIEGITSTYFHMREMPKVKKGDKVTKKTFLGYYGATGEKVTGAHLHVQFDTDIKNPLNCSGLASKGHSVLKEGKIDSTVDPTEWIWRAKGQKVTAFSSTWYNAKDFLNIPEIPDSSEENGLLFKIGDNVSFNGNTHYVGSNSATGKKCKGGKAKITAIAKGAKHPYHLKYIPGGGSNVYGWVDAEFIEGM